MLSVARQSSGCIDVDDDIGTTGAVASIVCIDVDDSDSVGTTRNSQIDFDAAYARMLEEEEEQQQFKQAMKKRRMALIESDAELARKLEEEEIQLRVQRTQFSCTVCMDQKHDADRFTAACGHNEVCSGCMGQDVSMKVKDGRVSKEHLRCLVPGCTQALTCWEVTDLLERVGKPHYIELYDDAKLHEATSGVGNGLGVAFCKCPKCQTKSFLTQEEATGPGSHYFCSYCNHYFCSKCVAPRAHFLRDTLSGCDCREAMKQKQAEWLHFLATGLPAHLANIAKDDAEYERLLKNHEDDAAAAQRAYETFMNDEQAKAHWVLCPKCGAAWEGSDACPSVTCGVLEQRMGATRATGVGCGHSFSLETAEKYRPVRLSAPALAVSKPQKRAQVIHVDVNCDVCNGEIQGLRLRCLNCPWYNICVPCLAKHGHDHAAEEEFPGRKEAPHIFEVIDAAEV